MTCRMVREVVSCAARRRRLATERFVVGLASFVWAWSAGVALAQVPDGSLLEAHTAYVVAERALHGAMIVALDELSTEMGVTMRGNGERPSRRTAPKPGPWTERRQKGGTVAGSMAMAGSCG